ncbi:hypothetical protein KDW_43500 [Dictyobacter vulcani]|uniref:Carrier domain-containing protein n=1 Tax=Dictyobacter vulcani TaxID=2607529 RepID=A0A5J4KKA6_9CHLR|nr:condensation domain-containing protein [Dictyobacter vulcani]GER90188.1 hypothetical protein KDW_43500 [Dictyobacter vulcani]
MSNATYSAPRTPFEQQLSEIWSQVLGLPQVGIHENFFALGGDSILSIQIVARANQTGLNLTPKMLFQHQTIADLARVMAKEEAESAIEAEQGIISGPVVLTPIGHWFIEQQQPQPNHWNQAILVSVRQRLEQTLLEQVVKQMLEHHDALRLRLLQTEANSWQLTQALPDEEVPLTVLDLSEMPMAEQQTVFEEAVNTVQTQLDIVNGPLLRIVYFDLGHSRLAVC